MFTSLLKALGAGLSIWEHKEKNKYVKKLYELEKKYYEETNKPDYDNAVIDNLEFDICLLSRGFASEVEQSKA